MPSVCAPSTDTLELKASKENAHTGTIFSLGFDTSGTKLVSGGQDGTLKLWDAGEPLIRPTTVMYPPMTLLGELCRYA